MVRSARLVDVRTMQCIFIGRTLFVRPIVRTYAVRYVVHPLRSYDITHNTQELCDGAMYSTYIRSYYVRCITMDCSRSRCIHYVIYVVTHFVRVKMVCRCQTQTCLRFLIAQSNLLWAYTIVTSYERT